MKDKKGKIIASFPVPRLNARELNARFSECDDKTNVFLEVMSDDDVMQIAKALLISFAATASEIIDEIESQTGSRTLDKKADEFLSQGVCKVLFMTENQRGDTSYGMAGGTFQGDNGHGYQSSWNEFVDALAERIYELQAPATISIWTRIETTIHGQSFKIDGGTIDGRRVSGSIPVDLDDPELIGGDSHFILDRDDCVELVNRFWVALKTVAKRDRQRSASELN